MRRALRGHLYNQGTSCTVIGRRTEDAGFLIPAHTAHGQNATSRPSERLKLAPPATGSRYQNWKCQVEPAVIWPLAWGGFKYSRLQLPMPDAHVIQAGVL